MKRDVVDRYFGDLHKTITELGLREKPAQIWNCDETGLTFCPDASKVLAAKGARNVEARCSPSKDNITTLVCVNAAGSVMPPMCVVKGKTNRSIHSFAIQDSPEGTIWAYQENGWMNDDIGVQWFQQVFLPNCGDSRSQLLILDSHHSHEVLELLEMAKEQLVHVLALPPHTTHMLQPLDRVVFKPFKTAYRRHCIEFLTANPGKTINKVTWPSLLSKTWMSTLKPELIQKAFEATGIHPVDRTRIPESAFLPGDAYRAAVATASLSSTESEPVVATASSSSTESEPGSEPAATPTPCPMEVEE
ncbi:jerky protein homolog-like [Aplysia californica]|uniref:Jerky protein homolog-like n=1 Tax=Aplysia californica TaxID=6500 RepID=A0ABM0KBJ0_APLCA|nr:jerky protein homolog-like [Aplysia californica]